MNRAAKSEPTADSRAVTNTAEAELLMKHLMDVMDALLRHRSSRKPNWCGPAT